MSRAENSPCGQENHFLRLASRFPSLMNFAPATIKQDGEASPTKHPYRKLGVIQQLLAVNLRSRMLSLSARCLGGFWIFSTGLSRVLDRGVKSQP